MKALFLGREPALVLGLISSAISLAIGFGLELTAEQVGLIMSFVTALSSWIVRAQVTPIIDPKGGGECTPSD